MQLLSWSDLQFFLAVARAGHLSRAARTMQVDATTVARRLRRLERDIGQTLFEQTREGQVLTDVGERLLARVEAMESAALDLEALRSVDRAVSGSLRVSVSEGFGTWFIAHYLHEFLQRYPQVTVDLVASSGFLSPTKRETDLAVLLARPRSGPVQSSKLSDYTLRLYGARDYLDAHGAPESAAALGAHRLVGYVPELLYASELAYLGEINPELVATARSTSINAQYRLIASGAGLGVLPRFIGDTDPTLVPVLPEKVIRRSFWIVTHRDTHQLRRIRAFRQWLMELVATKREIFDPELPD